MFSIKRLFNQQGVVTIIIIIKFNLFDIITSNYKANLAFIHITNQFIIYVDFAIIL